MALDSLKKRQRLGGRRAFFMLLAKDYSQFDAYARNLITCLKLLGKLSKIVKRQKGNYRLETKVDKL